MIWIALFTWLMIVLAGPLTENYATIQQIEQAYVLVLLLYVFNKHGTNVGKGLLNIFCLYYIWIASTDYVISYIPDWVCNLESLIVFSILVIRYSQLTNSNKT